MRTVAATSKARVIRFGDNENRILLVMAILLGFGLVMTLDLGYYSATKEMSDDYFWTICKFVFSVIVGCLIALYIRKLRAGSLYALAHILMLLSLLMLVLVWLKGVEVNQAQRWLEISGYRFQPVELFKVAVALGLASALAGRHVNSGGKRLHRFLSTVFWIEFLICMFLIYKQPNHSAIIIILLAGFIIALMSRVKWQVVIGLALVIMIAAGAFIWQSPEKRNRIRAWFIKPDVSESITLKDERFQVDRAHEAIVSGGLFGKGLGRSTVKYSLPAASTDFVFAILVEEIGFIGGFILLLCYLFLILQAFNVTAGQNNDFLRLAGAGVTIFLALNVLMHVAVNLDLMPTTGVPLPFVSKGGSALLLHLVSIGFILNLARRRDIENNIKS